MRIQENVSPSTTIVSRRVKVPASFTSDGLETETESTRLSIRRRRDLETKLYFILAYLRLTSRNRFSVRSWIFKQIWTLISRIGQFCHNVYRLLRRYWLSRLVLGGALIAQWLLRLALLMHHGLHRLLVVHRLLWEGPLTYTLLNDTLILQRNLRKILAVHTRHNTLGSS